MFAVNAALTGDDKVGACSAVKDTDWVECLTTCNSFVVTGDIGLVLQNYIKIPYNSNAQDLPKIYLIIDRKMLTENVGILNRIVLSAKIVGLCFYFLKTVCLHFVTKMLIDN